MADRTILTAARLREVLHYNPKTGRFDWLKKTSRFHDATRPVGNVHEGYLRIGIDGRNYKAAPLAWLWMTGEWPKDEVDHRNRNSLDNKWRNLREATHKQNSHNRGVNKNNTSGATGVFWYRRNKKWAVKVAGVYYGLFKTKEHAMRIAWLHRTRFVSFVDTPRRRTSANHY